MRFRNKLKGTLVSLVVSTGAASADDVASLIGNEIYRNFNPVPAARTVLV